MVNNVVTFFFLENAENLGRSDDAKRRKKERGPGDTQKEKRLRDRLNYYFYLNFYNNCTKRDT